MKGFCQEPWPAPPCGSLGGKGGDLGAAGGSSRPRRPPRRPPHGRSQRLVSWGLQTYSGLFPHDACGMQASRGLWALGAVSAVFPASAVAQTRHRVVLQREQFG